MLRLLDDLVPRLLADLGPDHAIGAGGAVHGHPLGAAAGALHVHPNTVRYRIRRVEKLMATSLDDPDVRLLLALSLRATA